MTVPQPPLQATERETLQAFLDYYRAVIVDKASGLQREDLNTRLAPSTLTLGAIVHHLALVENWWFHQCFAGREESEPWKGAPWDEDEDWDFTIAATLDPNTILERYRSEVERSRAIVGPVKDLDGLSVRTNRDGEAWSLRWILIHMIEETARHAGHMDLIRESVDGSTGDFRSGD